MPRLVSFSGSSAASLARTSVARSPVFRPAYHTIAPRSIAVLSRPLISHHTHILGSTSRTTGHYARGMAASPTAASAQPTAAPHDPVVQYVILRKDLWTEMKWPLGSVVAQACHASTAAMFTFLDDEITAKYIAPENVDSMHKVVLEVKGETQLRTLSGKLTEAGVKHKLWVEQPEDYPTCLATKPYHKSEVAQHFKKFQLCKAALSS